MSLLEKVMTTHDKKGKFNSGFIDMVKKMFVLWFEAAVSKHALHFYKLCKLYLRGVIVD